MAKRCSSAFLDAALQFLEDNIDRISVCETEPTTYAEATTNKGAGGYKLAISSTPTFTGPAAGDGGGYSRKTTVDQEAAITKALAHIREFTVRRVVDGQEQSLILPLEAAVQPEDLIVVREGQKVYVTGEVKTPGRYAYQAGATIQRVLTLAGGVTEKAEASVVKLTRTTEQGVETTVVPQDAVVLPEDIILVVPKSDKFYVSGEVKNPGSYTHKEGLSLQKALAMAGGVTERGDVERLHHVRIVNNQEEHPVVTLESPIMPGIRSLSRSGRSCT